MKPVRGHIARRIIFAYSGLAFVTILVSAGAIGGIRLLYQRLVLEARQRQEMSLLSARIRSEALLLANSVQQYVIDAESGEAERLALEKHIVMLEELLQQAVDGINPDNVDESIAVGLALQNIMSFKVQSRRILDLSDQEGGFGPETKRQMDALLQHYQPELIKSLEDFEKLEGSAAKSSYAQAHIYSLHLTIFIAMLSAAAVVFAIGMSIWLAKRLIIPLTALTENVKLQPELSLQRPIEISTDDEMGALAQALNQMKAEINASRDKLEEYADTLEEQVEERTRELKLLAITDPLTGIYNRGYFFALAEKILDETKRLNHPFSVALFDLDHFKNINDRFGHAAGDLALRQVARTMQSQIRQMDFLGRYGGEEFVVALPSTKISEALQIGQRIVIAARKMQVEYNGRSIHVTISGGVASYAYDDEDLGHILSKADKALYLAKKQGRDRVVAHNSTTGYMEKT